MPGRVLIAAGGTGGHLFPAEALAAALVARGWRVHLATDVRTEAYGRDFPAEEIHLVASATLTRRPVAAALGLARLGRGLLQARRLIRRIAPDVAVGFGGYPTLPPMLAAAFAGVPTVIHEANAVIGRANRFLAPRATRIATSVADLRGGERFRDRVVQTGNPVRPAVLKAAATPYPVRAASDPFRLLVFGGSQGARYLSDLLPAAVSLLDADARGRLRIVQQCRPEDLDRVDRAFRERHVDAGLKAFFDDLPDRIAASHLVVCRSGASTCTELAVIGRPAIMVPLPGALDQDQKANAMVLERGGGGWMVAQRDMSPERLAARLGELIAAPGRLAAAAAAARGLARPDAVERLADLAEATAARKPAGVGAEVPA
jgi:UDP-N-acetylglucosamine--N-acetylmuramyl-(pentapeptide) pyrophosphoryl-undecaprenol N-acetylglucosamine transferase